MKWIFIITILIIYIIARHTFYIDFKKIIKQLTKNNYAITLGYLPVVNSKTQYYEFYKMIDFLLPLNNGSLLLPQTNKISLKPKQLGETRKKQIENFISIIKYANKNNVFVWISATTSDNLDNEYWFYKLARNIGYQNIGLTLATYHNDVSRRVDNILKHNGHVRLVKGYYYGYLSNNWQEVGKLFEENAEKLARSGNYHCIATHDFDILSSLVNKNFNLNNIEFAFFETGKNYVNYEIQKKGLLDKLLYKSLYIPYGQIFPYVEDNLLLLDIPKIIPRKINQIKYNYFSTLS
jgi:hypothetical protein